MNDGRNIDPAIGSLSGEGSQQRIRERRLEEIAVEAFNRVPSEHDHTTYYDRPVIKRPVWKWYIPAYFTSGGIAGAAATLGAVAQLFGGKEMKPLVDRCRRIAFAGTAVGTAFLIADLGRKERFLNMLRVFRPTSPMSIGSWILAPTAGAAAASVVLPGPLGGAAGLAAGALGPALASYTAILTSNTAVPFWHATRRALPALYVSSAASGAASLLAMGSLDGSAERAVRILDVTASAAELIAMHATETEAAKVERVAKPLHGGTAGSLWTAAKVCAALSLVLRGRRLRKLSALLGFLGSVAAKFAIFRAGLASANDPRATFEQQRARSV